jgi:hypothetical protein
MSTNKLTIAEIQPATFAGNATITLVRPARTTKVVKEGVEVAVEQPATRYTFKVVRAKGDESSRPWFVKVMFGPSNEDDFVFLGTVFASEDGLVFRSSAKSPIKPTDARFVAFNWLVERLAELSRADMAAFEAKLAGQLFADLEVGESVATAVHDLSRVEVWFEAACCRCGRKLTVPSSIARYLGPECAKKIGVLA